VRHQDVQDRGLIEALSTSLFADRVTRITRYLSSDGRAAASIGETGGLTARPISFSRR
jgi:hypothetical protein